MFTFAFIRHGSRSKQIAPLFFFSIISVISCILIQKKGLRINQIVVACTVPYTGRKVHSVAFVSVAKLYKNLGRVGNDVEKPAHVD